MKKISKFLGLIALAALAINVQSCKDDEDDTPSYLGSWRMTEEAFMCEAEDYDKSDSTHMYYTKFEPEYVYNAHYEGNGVWNVTRSKYTYKEGQITRDNEVWSSVCVNDNVLMLVSEYWDETFEKEELPAEVEAMIANGEYTEEED